MPTLTIPNSFTAATTIVASEMNANFTAIRTLLNGLVDATNLANGAVTENKLGDLSVSTAKLAAGAVTDAKVAAGIDAAKLADGTVSNAEFQYLNGVTSAIQTQLDAKRATATAIGTADLADAAVTPAKTSFAGDLGASGQVYFGAVKSDGLDFRLPSGWSASRSTTGNYIITHDLGTDNYVVLLTAGDGPVGGSWNAYHNAAVIAHTTSAFVVRIGFPSIPPREEDGSFHFIVIRY